MCTNLRVCLVCSLSVYSVVLEVQKLPFINLIQNMWLCRYEKEVMHPLLNLLGGELARALLIQVSCYSDCNTRKLAMLVFPFSLCKD
jgi:hypothetical protein